MKKILLFLLYFFIISTFVLFLSCKEETTAPQNQKPQIQSLSANPSTIKVNEETTLTCVATDPDGDNLTVSWTAPSGTFPNGNVGTSVKWKAPNSIGVYSITATVSDGKDTDKDVVSVTVETGGTAPQEPTLSSPSNGATNISVSTTLSWNSSSGATSYTLQVSTNSNFSSFVYNQSGLTGTSQQVTGLNNSTQYYWRVSATNSYGTSGWSTVWNFTTASGSGGGQPCPGIPTVTYAGKTYNTVLIGSQCWLRENLDIGTRINGSQNQTNNNVIEKYCYNNDQNNCNTYGGLYQWNEAMQYSTTPGTQGICPPGWHIPTYAEFQTLSTTVGGDGNALKSIGQGSGGGAGTNTSGFSALLAGYRLTNGSFSLLGTNTFFWSSTEYSSTYAYTLHLYGTNSSIYLDYFTKETGFSVRCLKD